MVSLYQAFSTKIVIVDEKSVKMNENFKAWSYPRKFFSFMIYHSFEKYLWAKMIRSQTWKEVVWRKSKNHEEDLFLNQMKAFKFWAKFIFTSEKKKSLPIRIGEDLHQLNSTKPLFVKLD